MPNYPGSLPALLENYADATSSATAHPNAHNAVNDEVNAIGAELGINPRGLFATVKARLDAIEGGVVNAPAPTGVGATDRAAIDTAVSNLAGPGVVQLQKGDYRLDQFISIPDGVWIRGRGPGATKISAPSSIVYPVRLIGTVPAFADRVVLTATALKSPTAATSWVPKIAVPTTSRAGWLGGALTAGDYVLLGSNTAWPLTLESTTHGEIVRIRTIDSTSLATLWSMVNADYTTADGAYAWKINFCEGAAISDLTIENTTPGTTANGLLWMEYAHKCLVQNVVFSKSDERGIRMVNSLDCHVISCRFQDQIDQSNTSPILLGYGVSMFNATQQSSVRMCTGDRLRNLTTTNGNAAPGVPRDNEFADCIMWNATNNAYSGHEEGEHNRYTNLKAFGGAQNSTGASHGAGHGAGLSLRHPRATIQNFECVGAQRFGVWIREGGSNSIIDGMIIKDTHYTSDSSARAFEIEGDECRARNVIIDSVDDIGCTVLGDGNDIEVDIRRPGLNGAWNPPTPSTQGALQFKSDFGGSNNLVRLRVKDAVAAILADSGTVTGNRVELLGLQNCPVGDTKWVTENAVRMTVRAAGVGNVNTASPGATHDGVTLTAGQRLLLKDQTTQSQNGPWVFNGAAVALTRPPDLLSKPFDTLEVSVEQGTVNNDSSWRLETNNPITIGTTNLVFRRIVGNQRQLNLVQFYPEAGHAVGASISSTTLSATICRIYPFYVHDAIVVNTVKIKSIAAIANAFQFGIFDENGTRVWTSGAQSTVVGVMNVTTNLPVTLRQGTYYFGVTNNNTASGTASLSVSAAAGSAGYPRWGTVAATSGAMPASITPSAITETVGGWPIFVQLSEWTT